MAASLRGMFCRVFANKFSVIEQSSIFVTARHLKHCANNNIRCQSTGSGRFVRIYPRAFSRTLGICVVGGVSVAAYMLSSTSNKSSVFAEQSSVQKPKIKPSRMIRSNTDNSGLKLTLFQYQSCPFCCKVRAYLDFHGFSYDVIEVNSVSRAEIRWSDYKKVPILVCQTDDSDAVLQLNDSSVIISLLESYLLDRSQTVETLQSFYPAIETTNSRGKTVFDFPNKYFVMFGESGSGIDEKKDERHWRQWTDDVLVHTLSPNIYRTPTESLQAFRHFSDVGDWSDIFGVFQRQLIIYVGATAMFFIGKLLKSRYKLNDDVRLSMYDACNEWMAAVHGSGGRFLGGDRPNLADLAVYGVLSSIEGCDAFADLVTETDISKWYRAVQNSVSVNAGQRETTENQLRLAA